MKAPIKCPACRHEGDVELFAVVQNGNVTCEQCGTTFDFVTQTQAELRLAMSRKANSLSSTLRTNEYTANLHTRLQCKESQITEQADRITKLRQPTNSDAVRLDALKRDAAELRNHIDVRRELFTPPRARTQKIDLE